MSSDTIFVGLQKYLTTGKAKALQCITETLLSQSKSDTVESLSVCKGRVGGYVPVSEKYFLGDPGKQLLDKSYTCGTGHPVHKIGFLDVIGLYQWSSLALLGILKCEKHLEETHW